MSTLLEITEQIEALQKKAAEIRSNDLRSTIEDINAKIQAFGITPNDLVFPQTKNALKDGRSTRVFKTKNPVAAKYQGPNGQLWSGRGLTPKWLALAITDGKTKDDFLLKNSV